MDLAELSFRIEPVNRVLLRAYLSGTLEKLRYALEALFAFDFRNM